MPSYPACCGVTALWAAFDAAFGAELQGIAGFLDLARAIAWYTYLLFLYRQSGAASSTQLKCFFVVGLLGCVGSLSLLFTAVNGLSNYSLLYPPVVIRLLIGITELLLIENLYFNLPQNARWHIALPCILLAVLSCFDILVAADAVLFRRPSFALEYGRVVAMVIVAPLLVLAAVRSQRWTESIRLSRLAVFHSATLVLSGSVLLSLALAGEVLRRFDETWGWVAEVSLVFSGILGILLFVSSRSARSLIDQMVVYHFFADRYDYRRQWLTCIKTLSGAGDGERDGFSSRAIQTIADIVNSPSGALFVASDMSRSMAWSYSWNMSSTTDIPYSHPLMKRLLNNPEVIDLAAHAEPLDINKPLTQLGPIWLAVPLRHPSKVVGLIIIGHPRVAFRIDQEVLDLLSILGQEVGMYIAEQKATEAVFQTRMLHTYGKRFSFVAHDIKNVSSQLALLVANADIHLSNPDFQQDMLGTVRASVRKIAYLLKRLDDAGDSKIVPSTNAIASLASFVARHPRAKQLRFVSGHSLPPMYAAISDDSLETALSHLVNNALEAASTHVVEICVRGERDKIIIEISDRGQGMSSEFIRDQLFLPFRTNKRGGSGIGAYQARELIREIGGELVVVSQVGVGTTVCIELPNADWESSPTSQRATAARMFGGTSG